MTFRNFVTQRNGSAFLITDAVCRQAIRSYHANHPDSDLCERLLSLQDDNLVNEVEMLYFRAEQKERQKEIDPGLELEQ